MQTPKALLEKGTELATKVFLPILPFLQETTQITSHQTLSCDNRPILILAPEAIQGYALSTSWDCCTHLIK